MLIGHDLKNSQHVLHLPDPYVVSLDPFLSAWTFYFSSDTLSSKLLYISERRDTLSREGIVAGTPLTVLCDRAMYTDRRLGEL